MNEKTVTLDTLGHDIRDRREATQKTDDGGNLLFAHYAAVAVLDGIARKDAFANLKSIIGDDTVEKAEWLKFSLRRVGMGFRVIKGTASKPAHKKATEIIKAWKTGKFSKGNGLNTRYLEMLGGSRNQKTIELKLADVLKEFKTQNKIDVAMGIVAEVFGLAEVV